MLATVLMSAMCSRCLSSPLFFSYKWNRFPRLSPLPICWINQFRFVSFSALLFDFNRQLTVWFRSSDIVLMLFSWWIEIFAGGFLPSPTTADDRVFHRLWHLLLPGDSLSPLSFRWNRPSTWFLPNWMVTFVNKRWTLFRGCLWAATDCKIHSFQGLHGVCEVSSAGRHMPCVGPIPERGRRLYIQDGSR